MPMRAHRSPWERPWSRTHSRASALPQKVAACACRAVVPGGAAGTGSRALPATGQPGNRRRRPVGASARALTAAVPGRRASAAQRCPRIARASAPDAHAGALVTVGATLVANGVRAQARSHRKSLHPLATRWFRAACQARVEDAAGNRATGQPVPPTCGCICACTVCGGPGPAGKRRAKVPKDRARAPLMPGGRRSPWERPWSRTGFARKRARSQARSHKEVTACACHAVVPGGTSGTGSRALPATEQPAAPTCGRVCACTVCGGPGPAGKRRAKVPTDRARERS